MALKGKGNLQVANTVARERFQELFNAPSNDTYTLFTEVFSDGALRTNNIAAMFLNTVREWVGSKEYGTADVFSQNIDLTAYEHSFELDRLTLDYESSGVIARMISQWVEQTRRNGDDKIVFDALVSNSGNGPTGIDGSSLFTTTHSLGGTNYSNKTTSALSFTTYDAAVQAMQGYRTANGEPLGCFPTHLFVGPKLRKAALDIAGADARVVAVNGSGTITEEGTSASSAVAATLRPNLFQGEVTVVLWDRLVGTQDDYWYLMDLSKQSKPMLLKNERDWTLSQLTNDTDMPRFEEGKYLWSIEGDKKPAAGAWQVIYAGIL